MRFVGPPGLIAAGTLYYAASVSAANIQKAGLTVPQTAQAHRDAVVEIFTTSFDAYKEFAFGHDDLSPVSRGFSDGRNGWGASIIDAMSTMAVMGLESDLAVAVEFASQIDFNQSKVDETVSVFETTIRYLGGLLSAYELTDGKFPVLVEKAKQVADKMAFAWRSPSQVVPFGELNFTTNTPLVQTSNIAEAGTLTLEWSRLSQYTHNNTYADLVLKSVEHIASLPAPLPGLAAQGIDPSTGNFVGGYVTWGGGSDSYFEYLIKYARLSNTDNNLFADTWHTAVDSSIKTLLKTSTVGNRYYLADFDGAINEVVHVGSHLACFYGGNWLMGGRLMNNQTIVNIALELVDACWNTYASTATGIGPETFAFISPEPNGNFTEGSPPTPEQLDFYNEHGFYITTPDYILRPEVLESNFYAWRVTGDTKYLDRAASAVDSFNKFLPPAGGVAFAGLNDVNNVNGGWIDDTESFWFAEVLKYLYLTFDDPNHISLDEWVFNTECHPLRAPPAKPNYGSGALVASKTFHIKSGPPLPAISPNPHVTLPPPPNQA